MSLAQQINNLAQSIGLDIKDIGIKIGNLNALTTTDKSALVNALNEVLGKVNSLINDAAIAGVTTQTWSADKIIAYISQVKSDIMGGIAPAALDTILELAAQLQADQTSLNGILTALGNRPRVDAAQSYNSTEQAQVRSNIGAASQSALDTLVTNVGDVATDFVAAYTTAKA
jgi:hypothetical protein